MPVRPPQPHVRAEVARSSAPPPCAAVAQECCFHLDLKYNIGNDTWGGAPAPTALASPARRSRARAPIVVAVFSLPRGTASGRRRASGASLRRRMGASARSTRRERRATACTPACGPAARSGARAATRRRRLTPTTVGCRSAPGSSAPAAVVGAAGRPQGALLGPRRRQDRATPRAGPLRAAFVRRGAFSLPPLLRSRSRASPSSFVSRAVPAPAPAPRPRCDPVATPLRPRHPRPRPPISAWAQLRPHHPRPRRPHPRFARATPMIMGSWDHVPMIVDGTMNDHSWAY